ncbi:MAG TPA: isopentenyl phosphate kinase, partial [Anaerolineales bacterium]|nr:isopentenyl phosphate kinase [Anaerolineales bacterium]
MTQIDLTFLKLGGSLITVKAAPRVPRTDVLERIAAEIAETLSAVPAPGLLIGHGSGSFGHVPAAAHGTRGGVSDPAGWGGFVEVWRAAGDLNHMVVRALQDAGIQAIGFPPSAVVTAEAGEIATWDTLPIRAALAAGLIPVVYGDVAFDRVIGGTILSTEKLFAHLVPVLNPVRILIAGIEAGVWVDYPQRSDLIPVIDPGLAKDRWAGIRGAEDPDVTGGMRAKVASMLNLVAENPQL